MTERVKRTDRVSSAERLRYYEGLVGLQVRLLMGGETLNLHKLDLAAITKESLGNFDQRSYSPFISASTKERKDYWRGKENNGTGYFHNLKLIPNTLLKKKPINSMTSTSPEKKKNQTSKNLSLMLLPLIEEIIIRSIIKD